jgi:hypothetical protein
LTANSTEHLPDWPAQNVGKMLTAFCGCFWLTDQFFDLTALESGDFWNKGRAEKRVPNQYHLSVPTVLFSHFALPSVPQNKRDTLSYAAWQS